ncbi:hypothetical protein RRG08_048476 [Elysia crispata]|uniref:Uncharacterized protein n=1 Tax=Elysia crispata TaxID=231223 RepID=A0AAE1A980_9GAST|nr:hypothetical protein RRG08_048476 [Elysia crispata]
MDDIAFDDFAHNDARDDGIDDETSFITPVGASFITPVGVETTPADDETSFITPVGVETTPADDETSFITPVGVETTPADDETSFNIPVGVETTPADDETSFITPVGVETTSADDETSFITPVGVETTPADDETSFNIPVGVETTPADDETSFNIPVGVETTPADDETLFNIPVGVETTPADDETSFNIPVGVETTPADDETSFNIPDAPKPPDFDPPTQPGNNIQTLNVELQKQRLVETYYRAINEAYDLSPQEIPYDQFSIGEDGKTLYWTPKGGNEIRVSAVKGGVDFRVLSTLAQEYGDGGTDAIRKSLELQEYTSKTRKLSAVGEKALQQAADTLPAGGENIALQDFSSVADDAIASAEMATTALDKELTSEQAAALATIDDPPLDVQWVEQAKRELRGLGLAMTRTRDELVNNLAKLTELDEHIGLEKRKLDEARDGIDESIRRRIAERLRDLLDERASRLEAASATREALRFQISRIRETISRLLLEDTTLAERIRTLFREQGITIASILTAIGMTISTLVLALVGSGGSTPSPAPPQPPGKGGIKEWIKKHLQSLG